MQDVVQMTAIGAPGHIPLVSYLDVVQIVALWPLGQCLPLRLDIDELFIKFQDAAEVGFMLTVGEPY
jgi:hypothetical protein